MNNHNYGFIFNDIKIVDNMVVKKSKNQKGNDKISSEMDFYKFIITNNVKFPIPQISQLDYDKNMIVMEYLKDYEPLLNFFYKFEDNLLLKRILSLINELHCYKISVSKEKYLNNLSIEINDKIKIRYNETNWNDIKYFNNIKTVNNVKIKDLDYYLSIINYRILKIINQKSTFEFCLIHGDIHLNNILIKNDNIRFIDPRGYFGKNKLYGVKEYDYAKLLFGITGYSFFDNMKINKLEVVDNNLNIQFIDKYLKHLYSEEFNEMTKLLVLTIWLGNNSCFVNNEKKVMSLMIALYLCETFL